MTVQESQESADTMVASLERIASYLQRLLIASYACAGLLGLISFVMVLKLMIGR